MKNRPASFYLVSLYSALLFTTALATLTYNLSQNLPHPHRQISVQSSTFNPTERADPPTASIPNAGSGAHGGPQRPAQPFKREKSCFPARAVISVLGKGRVTMKDLRIGDRLRLADASYGSVFMFSHRVRVGMFPFVTLHTTNASISVSHLHYLFSDKGLIVAGSVRVGDYLERSDGYVRVVAREDGFLEGLFNPHTETGEMVVDGFRVSCYTRHVEPRVAQALLAPLRAGFLLLGFDVSFGAFENGHGGVDLGLLAG